ncbi:MAG: glycoside hydrolase family 97 catalytic domain-containing protein, partial [Candidatus Competibacteraceae bacterium]|nr:glycoside hydrolase family 97 catalytic domain-containing protein [Candidatus Competibacteraceae bacterium]
ASDMVYHVNDPPDPDLFPQGPATDWIRPGRAVWSWWSDLYSGDFAIQRRYVDDAHQLGFEYVLVDAWWELGFPAEGKDQFQRLAELVDYAHRDGRQVDILVWKDWYEVLDREERRAFFAAVRQAGAVGVKFDIIDAGDSESQLNVQLHEAILRDAAEHQLMINFHGTHKPTGLARTWPNEITREGLMGLELNRLALEHSIAVPPWHNAALPFTRLVLGPGDYTPVTFDERKLGETTFTHQFASAGVMVSPLLHFADDPQRLLAQETVLDLLQALPTTWDESRVLPVSDIGRVAALVRRKGQDWWLFVLNGNGQQPLSLPALALDFLGEGGYRAELVADETATTFQRSERSSLTREDELDLQLLAGGGFLARFTPITSDGNQPRPFRLGFAQVPPSNDGEGWTRLYTTLAEHADLVAYSFQGGVPWPEALNSSDVADYPFHLRLLWQHLREGNRTAAPDHPIYLMINPIETSYERLAPYWGESGEHLPLPAPWNGYDFSQPEVRQAYINYLTAAIEYFQPTYLAINVEANILLAKRPWLWEGFKEFNQAVYTAIKTRYPQLKVFSTIHYEHMLALHSESIALVRQLADSYPDVLQAEVKALLAHSDLLALSTYPYMVFENPRLRGSPPTLDAHYYQEAYDMAAELGLPLAIDQTGFISQDLYFEPFDITLHGSEEAQSRFIAFLLEQAQGHDFEFVNNFLAVDYGQHYGTDPTTLTWSYTGLFNQDGSPKAALAIWDAALSRPLADLPPPPPPGPRLAGAVRSVSLGDNRVDLTLEDGFVARLELLDRDILRVRLNPSGQFSNWQSGAIALNGLQDPQAILHDGPEAVFMVTSQLSVIIQKAPFAISVLRPDGTLISADQPGNSGFDPNGGVIFNRKHAPPGERYLGLGLRGGPLDRRGQVMLL